MSLLPNTQGTFKVVLPGQTEVTTYTDYTQIPQEIDANVDACGGDEQSGHIAHDNEERMGDKEERGDQRAHVAPAC